MRARFAAWLCGMFVLTAPSAAQPDLFSYLSDNERAVMAEADRHMLVVRHARKIAPDCNALDCPLSSRGETMVDRLSQTLAPVTFNRALSSSACRTRDTARAANRAVELHRAADRLETGCGGVSVDRNRADAMTDIRASDAAWTLIGEHSNTVCLWVREFVSAADARAVGCGEGQSLAGYGDVFWLYRSEGVWKVLRLDHIFDVSE